jgi:hypothetical protein
MTEGVLRRGVGHTRRECGWDVAAVRAVPRAASAGKAVRTDETLPAAVAAVRVDEWISAPAAFDDIVERTARRFGRAWDSVEHATGEYLTAPVSEVCHVTASARTPRTS